MGKPGGATTAEAQATGIYFLMCDALTHEEPNQMHTKRRNGGEVPDLSAPVIPQICQALKQPRLKNSADIPPWRDILNEHIPQIIEQHRRAKTSTIIIK